MPTGSNNSEFNNKSIKNIDITDEMRKAYIDYAMSVIVSRAIPDVRDGLKPVQRRILFTMCELGLRYDTPHRKSVKIIGEVMGSYHPHGDSAIYIAMVHLGQKWSLRYLLIDGQGNFGSIDGDEPAAMRYTESRMTKLAEEMLADIDKDTIDWTLNFDETKKEPTVLPSKLPNLLVNGTSGIAVGMATNMAPHNLNEIVDGINAYIDNPDITVEELIKYIPGPDFPTGGIICGTKGILDAYNSGKGKIILRSKTEIVTNNTGKEQIIVTEIPFGVNKALLIEKIAELVNDKKIEGISDIKDESDKQGLRISIDIKRDAIAQVVLNNLFANTSLQYSFNVNNVCLVKGRPMTLGLKDLIKHFYDHRHEVTIRRISFELKQSQNRIHILDGYIIALDNIDPIISLIKSCKDSNEAISRFNTEYNLDKIQSKAILEMKLQRLTGLERSKIQKEHDELVETIKRLEAILADDNLVKDIIKNELIDIKSRCGDKRRTEIQLDYSDLTTKDIIPDEDVVITLSNQGFIKRTNLSEYRLQNRGGVGSKGSATKEDDFIKYLAISSTHKFLLAFTIKGELYWKHVYDIPDGEKNTKGKGIQNIFPIDSNDGLACILEVDNLNNDEYLNSHYIIFCTKKGIIKKTTLKAYSNVRANGIHGINIVEGDELLDVKLTDGYQEIILATRNGKAIRFNESQIRPVGRTAIGVKGVDLDDNTPDNEVVGIVTLDKNDEDRKLLVVSERGFGKKSCIHDYRITNRGCKGIKTINITKKTGRLVSICDVKENNELMIINDSGVAIRISTNDIRTASRNTQGVRLIKVPEGEVIKSIAKIENVE